MKANMNIWINEGGGVLMKWRTTASRMKTNLLWVKDVVEEGGVSPAGGEQIDPVLFLRGVDGAPGFFLLDFDAGDVGKDSDVPLTEVRALALQHAHAGKAGQCHCVWVQG